MSRLFYTSLIALFVFLGLGYAYGSDASIDLKGTWYLKLDPNDQGINKEWFNTAPSDPITLPGSTLINGYGDDITMDTPWTASIGLWWLTHKDYEECRQPGNIRVPFWLTPEKTYVGPAWYHREVEVPSTWTGQHIRLHLERCHWQSSVWVNGRKVTDIDSLTTSHNYDLSEFIKPGVKNHIAIRIDNRVHFNFGINSHSITDQSQSNWNGIIGQIKLFASDRVLFDDVQIYPDVKNKSARVKIKLSNTLGKQVQGQLRVRASSFNVADRHTPQDKIIPLSIPAEGTIIELDYPMGNAVQLWDEFSTALYSMTLDFVANSRRTKCTRTVEFGMREITIEGTRFAMNGRPIFLRGTVECAVFPLTGYPPMDIDSWLRIFRVCKEYGINHMRFHSWCPPEAAFLAANRIGVYLQPETPTWTGLGKDKKADEYLYSQAKKILKEYGNHPSFTMLCGGNQMGKGSDKILTDWNKTWKEFDSRRMYVGSAGHNPGGNADYKIYKSARLYGFRLGLESRINARQPETTADYSSVQKEQPLVHHEIGQWCVYPNFREMEKYTGPFKPKNFDFFRETLSDNHMLHLADDFVKASGKLQAICYKEELESMLRTDGLGGYQILQLNDFTGQGSALVGVLDPFWDSKSYVTAKEFYEFCSETVPLALMKGLYWYNDESFKAVLKLSHFGAQDLKGQKVKWSLTDAGKTLAEGKITGDYETGKLQPIGDVSASLASISSMRKVVFKVSLPGTPFENHWDLWVFPRKLEPLSKDRVHITSTLDKEALQKLESDVPVLLLADPESLVPGKKGRPTVGYSTVFWNTAYTKNSPPQTMGILCEPEHPLFNLFPTDYYSSQQWWDIVHESAALQLDEMPENVRPLVRLIDTWHYNRRLALLVEAKVNKGRLIICGANLTDSLDQRPSARQFRKSLLSYMNSADFKPQVELSIDQVESFFLKFPGKVIRSERNLRGNEGYYAIDGNPDTHWFSSNKNEKRKHAQEIVIQLNEITSLKGISVQQRQESKAGHISDYELYVSDNGEDWKIAASGKLSNSKKKQSIRFPDPLDIRYFKLKTVAEANAALAEISLLE
jgi:hypothetical protein